MSSAVILIGSRFVMSSMANSLGLSSHYTAFPGRSAASYLRFPGAAQHQVVRCRPGTVTGSALLARAPRAQTPDQRCIAPLTLRAAPRPGNVTAIVSRAQRSTKWCAADPGPSRAPRSWHARRVRRPRISGASLRAAPRPGNALFRHRDRPHILRHLVALLHRRTLGDGAIPAFDVGIFVQIHRLPFEARDPGPDRDIGDGIVVGNVFVGREPL